MVDLDELERLLGLATPGPLVVLDATPIGAQVLSIASDARPELVIVARIANTVSGRQIGDEDRANAALFVALRNAAEELIRDARRWREHEALMRRVIRIEEGM